MTDAGAASGAKADTQLDARILQLILKGQLKETSSVADSDTGEAVLLADHPRFSKVLHLARVNRSLGILKNISWWASRDPEWSNTLTNKPMAQALFETARQHATGFLVIQNEEQAKIIAFSAGLTIAVGSNLKREHLHEVIMADNGVEEAAMAEAQAHAEANQRELEWALLDEDLLEVDDLLGYYEHQAHRRLFDLFEWRSGDIGFHVDDRAAQLENVVNMPLMTLLRSGCWEKRAVGTSQLQAACAPILEHPEPLRLLQPIGTLKFGLTEIEAIVVAAAKNHAQPSGLLVDLERIGPEAVVEGLRFLYLFTQVGMIGVEGPEHAQPILEDIEAEDGTGASPDFGEMMLPIMGLDPGDAGARPLSGKGKRRMTGPVGVQAVKPERRMTGSSQLKEYRLQLQLEAEGRRLLNAGQYGEAVTKFKQLIERQDRPVQALAYLSVAALLTGTPEGRNNCQDYASRAVDLDKESALAHAAMARVLGGLGRKGADRHEKRALALSQYNDSWYLEVKGLLELGRAKPKLAADGAPGAVALVASLLLFACLFVGANLLGKGATEYLYSGDDWFFYVRRGSLLVIGLLGLKLATRAPFLRLFKELRFNFVFAATFFALIWGSLVGFLSPGQRVDGSLAVVLGLTVFHVFSEEVFFRGFVTRALLDQFGGDWQRAIPISALLYGAYHLTYYSFWVETELGPKFYWCAVIGLFAGIPYALLYQRTKGITAPLVCHLGVNGIMMARSLLGF